MGSAKLDYHRFAIYAAPPADHPLGRFGAAWLGFDAEQYRALPHPAIEGLPRPVEELTRTPRRYGLHGTLKAPMRLKAGHSATALTAAMSDFAEDAAPIPLPPLELSVAHGFVALRLSEPAPAFDALVGEIVEQFDVFRAPAGEDELARRRAAGLSARQEANLTRWGYPYVGEDFHFHLTLTGRLSDAEAAQTVEALRAPLAPALAEPWLFRSICLFGDPGGGRHFKLLKRYQLTG